MAKKLLTLIRIGSETNSRLHMVDRDQFFIGRANESDVLIADPSVSRKHAMIEVKGSEIHLTDLSSSNGTFVNDVKLEPNKKCILSPNVAIRLGKSGELIKLEVMERPVEFGEYQDLLPQFTKELEGVSEKLIKEAEVKASQEVEILKKQMLAKVDQEIEQIKKGESQAVQQRMSRN